MLVFCTILFLCTMHMHSANGFAIVGVSIPQPVIVSAFWNAGC